MNPGGIVCFLLLAQCLQISVGAPAQDNDESFAVHYLKEYHYLSPLRNGNHNFRDAVRMFQENADIPDTGSLDARTIAEMHKPRCGIPDMDDEEETSGRIKRNFATSGHKWNKRQLTYEFTNYASKGGLTAAEQRNIVRRAFSRWEAISPLTFSDVTNAVKKRTIADITITFLTGKHGSCTFDFDGAGGSYAHAYYPEDGVAHFDDDEYYTDGVSTGINLFSVALHEIGHLLGLKHTKTPSAIMHDTYKSYDPNMSLTLVEVHGIDYIYVGATAKPNTTISPQNCSDKMTNCHNYKSQCDDPQSGDAMKANCPLTCGQCVGQGVACKNVKTDPICKRWDAMGLCKVPFVQLNCKKTCNGCSAGK